MTDIVVNAMTRAVDPGYDDSETEEEEQAASATADPNRLTFHVPTYSTVWSLGKATEEEHWGDWHGTWGGIMGVTQRDIWLASSGACIIAGFVGPEGEPRSGAAGVWDKAKDAANEANPMGADKSVKVEEVNEAREQAEDAVKISELVLASLGLVDYALHFTPGFFGYVSGVLSVAGVGMGIYKVAAPGEEGKMPEGTIHLHGAREVLLTSPRAVRTAATMQNCVIGGISAELVGGWSAGVHGLAWAELAAYYGVEVKAIAEVGITCDHKVEVSSRRGTVEVQGKTIEVGASKIHKTGFLLGRQKPTETVEIKATDEIALLAGADGAARFRLVGTGGKAELDTGKSSLCFEEGHWHALVGNAGLELKEGGLSLVYVPVAPDVAALMSAADEIFKNARTAAWTTYKAAKATYNKEILLAAGAIGAFFGAAAGTGVGAAAGGNAAGALGGLAGGLAGGATIGAGGPALAMLLKQEQAASEVRDRALGVAKRVHQTAVSAAHEAPKLAVEAAGANPLSPRIMIKSDSVLIGMGAASIEVKADGVVVDASPVGSLTLKSGTSEVKLAMGSVTIDGGPGTVKLSAGGKECTLSAVGWKTPEGVEL